MEMQGSWKLYALLVGMHNGTATMGNVLACPQNVEHRYQITQQFQQSTHSHPNILPLSKFGISRSSQENSGKAHMFVIKSDHGLEFSLQSPCEPDICNGHTIHSHYYKSSLFEKTLSNSSSCNLNSTSSLILFVIKCPSSVVSCYFNISYIPFIFTFVFVCISSACMTRRAFQFFSC